MEDGRYDKKQEVTTTGEGAWAERMRGQRSSKPKKHPTPTRGSENEE